MSPGSDKFVAIHVLFKETLGVASMDRVQRVENGPQHEFFSAYKRAVEREMGSTFNHAKHVRLLFHGTSEEAVQSIIQSNTAGFLPMLAGSTTGALYGDGTYFASSASYSNNYACRLASGQKQMLIAEVVVGRWALGKKGDKVYPLLPGEKYRRYDSLVNDESNPTIFVVQHSSAAYPAYLISYH